MAFLLSCLRSSPPRRDQAVAGRTKSLLTTVIGLAVGFLCCRSGSGQATRPAFTIEDRGPSFVRTLANTPGLNTRGDFATWHARETGPTQGVIFTSSGLVELAGTTEYPVVFPADLNDDLEVVGSLQATQDLRFTQGFRWANGRLALLSTLGYQQERQHRGQLAVVKQAGPCGDVA